MPICKNCRAGTELGLRVPQHGGCPECGAGMKEHWTATCPCGSRVHEEKDCSAKPVENKGKGKRECCKRCGRLIPYWRNSNYCSNECNLMPSEYNDAEARIFKRGIEIGKAAGVKMAMEKIDEKKSYSFVGAIPETNEYANGWNDCRKKARENREMNVNYFSPRNNMSQPEKEFKLTPGPTNNLKTCTHLQTCFTCGQSVGELIGEAEQRGYKKAIDETLEIIKLERKEWEKARIKRMQNKEEDEMEYGGINALQVVSEMISSHLSKLKNE